MSIKRYEVNGSSSVFEDESGSLVDYQDYAAREAKCAALAAESAGLKSWAQVRATSDDALEQDNYMALKIDWRQRSLAEIKTPATDAFLAEVRAQAHKEGAYFVANRMLAAWEAGFIEDTAKNAADIARMILTSTEFMANAPEGDFDRSFADGVLGVIAAQLRKGASA
ncbi:putative eae protein [Enterobacteriaceae bacterium ATCC 29904]|nr:putative eae protein [Enterobacteriaceae bacterium ATCC 29904]